MTASFERRSTVAAWKPPPHTSAGVAGRSSPPPSSFQPLFVSISARAGSEAAIVQFSQSRTVAHRQGIRPGYGWPVKPFNRQHPVRAYLNDPRNGHYDAKSFHFGVDVSAPTGTPVYAVAAGEVYLQARPQGGRGRRQAGTSSATGTSSRPSATIRSSASTSSSAASPTRAETALMSTSPSETPHMIAT